MRTFLALALAALAGCAVAASPDTASRRDDVTDVAPSAAKEQSLGNCWLYATASWVEGTYARATHEELDLSESYWTYWHWFDQLTDNTLGIQPGPIAVQQIAPEGNWRVAAEIIARYGWMRESDFIPEEAGLPRSARQHAALDAVNTAIRSGDIAHATAAQVIAVLNRAFALRPEIAGRLAASFGASGERTLHDPSVVLDPAIHRASELAAGADPSTKEELTIDDLIGQSPVVPPYRSYGKFPRLGAHAWQPVSSDARDSADAAAWNHELVKNVQRTLHSRRTVFLTWVIDESYLDERGVFEPARAAAEPAFPTQHASVITDYEVDLVPGFGRLAAGTTETRPEALAAALDERAVVQFFRVKNPWWGSYEADAKLGPFTPGMQGYNDLTLGYLESVWFHDRRLLGVVLPPDVYTRPEKPE